MNAGYFRAYSINASSTFGAEAPSIVASAFCSAYIFCAFIIKATTAIFAKVLALVMTRTFFLICMFAAGIIEAATAFGANFALLVRWSNEMTLAFLGVSGILALSVKATATLVAKALTFVWL